MAAWVARADIRRVARSTLLGAPHVPTTRRRVSIVLSGRPRRAQPPGAARTERAYGRGRAGWREEAGWDRSTWRYTRCEVGRGQGEEEPGAKTDLLAQPLDISFGELLALHQALNPAVEGWDGSGLDVGRGQLCGHAPDVLHVCVHSGNWAVGGFCRVGVVVKARGTGEVLSGSNGSSAWSTAVAKNRSNDVCVHWHVRLCFQARRGAGPRLGQNWAGGQVGAGAGGEWCRRAASSREMVGFVGRQGAALSCCSLSFAAFRRPWDPGSRVKFAQI